MSLTALERNAGVLISPFQSVEDTTAFRLLPSSRCSACRHWSSTSRSAWATTGAFATSPSPSSKLFASRILENWSDSLLRSDPVYANHLAFFPFPANVSSLAILGGLNSDVRWRQWPIFTPAGKLANFLESCTQPLATTLRSR